ncbi:MAG TPA: 6-bladed beta-propeller [Longimicrobiales bacterium]
MNLLTSYDWYQRRHCVPRIAFLFLFMLAAFAKKSDAQDNVVIPPGPICGRCVLKLQHMATLGSRDGPGALSGQIASIARDSGGRIYVVDYLRDSEIIVYDRSGRFVRTIGREGHGPGEYTSIGSLHITVDDTIHVFDFGNARHTILSPDGAFVRSHVFPGLVTQSTTTRSGVTVVGARIGTPERFGLPLHALLADGDSIISFGSESPVVRPDMRYLQERRISPSDGDRVWSAYESQYLIELWDVSGTKVKGFYRSVDWFPPYPVHHTITPDNAPYPVLAAIREGGGGRLWVATSVADLDWRDALGELTEGPEGPYYPVEDYSRLLDTMIEIIDPASGRLVLSQRISQMVVAILNGDTVVSYRTDVDGVPFLDVWGVSVHQ